MWGLAQQKCSKKEKERKAHVQYRGESLVRYTIRNIDGQNSHLYTHQRKFPFATEYFRAAFEITQLDDDSFSPFAGHFTSFPPGYSFSFLEEG